MKHEIVIKKGSDVRSAVIKVNSSVAQVSENIEKRGWRVMYFKKIEKSS